MKKILFIICVSLLLLVAIVGLFSRSNSNVPGNKSEQISAPIIQKGSVLYESGKISKANIDGSNRSYIKDAYGSIIDVVDGWIYYVDAGMGRIGSTGIYKVKDNEKIQLTSDDYILEAVLYKGSIYYALGPKINQNNTMFAGLYKIDIDGKNKVQISDQLASNINVADNYIYYSGVTADTNESTVNEKNSGIFKMDIDGTNKINIYNKVAKFLKVSDNHIYFSNSNDNCKLYRIKTDGSEEKKLNDDNSWDIQVDGDWIYYANNPYDGHTAMNLPLDQTKGNIYKITINGNKRTKLNSEAGRLTEVLNGWIYYSNWSELYKMKTDGSRKVIVK